jgi:hypothetical protein
VLPPTKVIGADVLETLKIVRSAIDGSGTFASRALSLIALTCRRIRMVAERVAPLSAGLVSAGLEGRGPGDQFQ